MIARVSFFRFFLALSILWVLDSRDLAASEVVDINTRDEKVRLLIDQPTNGSPKAVIVVLAGGHGKVKISVDGSMGKMRGNFAVRSRVTLWEFGFTTAVADPPTDLIGSKRGLKGARTTDEYAADMGAVVEYLRNRFNVPVWIHGTSRGTIGAAYAAIGNANTPKQPDGIVLSSGVMSSNNFPDHLLNIALDKISVPVLIQHHKKDACDITDPDDVPMVMEGLKNASVKKSIMYSDGSGAHGNVCTGKHFHGFPGIEAKVMSDLAAFVEQSLR